MFLMVFVKILIKAVSFSVLILQKKMKNKHFKIKNLRRGRF